MYNIQYVYERIPLIIGSVTPYDPFGWSVCWSICHDFLKGRKLQFDAPIGKLVISIRVYDNNNLRTVGRHIYIDNEQHNN